MEKLKDLHKTLEKLQRDASKKHYPQSEMDKKRENPDHVLKNHYYKTTANERKFMEEFVKAIENPLLLADEGKYANLIDAIAVEIPGIIKEALPVIHTPEARKFVEEAKAQLVPFIRDHKSVIENIESVKNHNIDVTAAVKAAENIPTGQTLYEKVLSASHGENRLLAMQNRAIAKSNERLGNTLSKLDAKVNKLNQDKTQLKKDKRRLKSEIDLSGDYALEQQDEAAQLEMELESMNNLTERLSQYEADNAQLETEKERLAREKEEVEQKAQELETEAASLRDLPERLSQYESENTQLTSEKERLAREAESAKSQAVFWQRNAEESGSNAAEKEQELSDAYKNLEAKEAELAKALEEAEQTIVVDQEQEEQIRTLQKDLDDARKIIEDHDKSILESVLDLGFSSFFEEDTDLRYKSIAENRLKQICELERDISEYKARIERFTKAAAENADVSRESAEQIKQLQDLVDTYEDRINGLDSSVVRKGLTIEHLREQKSKYESKIAELESERIDLQERIMFTEQDYESDVERLQSEIVELQERVTFTERDLDNAVAKASRYEFEIDNLKDMLELEEHAKDAVSNEYEEQLRIARTENQELKTRLETALNEVGETLTVDEASAESVEEDYQTLFRPAEIPTNSEDIEASGEDISNLASGETFTPLTVPSEIPAGSIDANIDSAEVNALRSELASVKSANATLNRKFMKLLEKYEKDAERRYDLFYIAEHDSKLSVDGRIELYKEYLRVAPEDMHIAGIVYSNFAELMGNKKQDYVAAEFLINKAIACAEKDLELNNTEEAKQRLNDYKADKLICKQAKDFFDVGVETIPSRKAA